MAKIDITKIEGFEELNKRLKQLDDRVTRREILKIQRRIAKPIVKTYSDLLPKGTVDVKRYGTTYPAGTLSKSVKVDTVPIRKSGGNPAIAIRPSKKGKYDSWYKFMVVHKGAKIGSNKKGSRKGKNTVVEEKRDEAWRKVEPAALKEAEEKTAAYIQKQINRLSQ